MKYTAERLIEALVGIDQARERKAIEQRAEQARKASYVVTVSRGYGSLGGAVAQALADRLGIGASDREILEAVARRAAVDIELVTRLDENVRHAGLTPWVALFRSESLSEQRFLDHLVTVIMNISRKGGVIVGRGAHLILGPERAFRVRIVGSLEQCAARIAKAEQLGPDQARERVLAVDHGREAFLQQYFGARSRDSSVYDIVLNSDRFSLDQMVELILQGMRLAGYQIV
jgi:Cytidylate kinase-like family